MIRIVTTTGETIRVKRGVPIRYEKIGTPGARRWHVLYTRSRGKDEERMPVRNISKIYNGK